MVDIIVPALGESVSEATVATWLKASGDAVQVDEPIVELETDKITVEVNAPASGVLSSQAVSEGDTVEIGAVLGAIEEGATAAPSAAPAEKEASPAPTAAPAPASSGKTSDHLSPAVQKMVNETGANPSAISGSGKDGRVTKGDVISHLQDPQAVAAKAGQPREERVKMTRLRSTIARRLKDAQNNAAILTTFNEVDMSHVMALRSSHKDEFEKKHGVKLGFMSFFAKAAVKALKELPAVNAEIDGNEVIYKNYYDIGVAVGTDQGLVVPIVRDADTLTFAGIEQTIVDLGKKARDGRLSMEDMTGGTFTISNGGVYGSMMSTPIINPPQSGILGLHNIVRRPVVVGKGENERIEIRPIMYLALSYDHRIIDGKEAVTFLVKIKQAMENPERLLLGL